MLLAPISMLTAGPSTGPVCDRQPLRASRGALGEQSICLPASGSESRVQVLNTLPLLVGSIRPPILSPPSPGSFEASEREGNSYLYHLFRIARLNPNGSGRGTILGPPSERQNICFVNSRPCPLITSAPRATEQSSFRLAQSIDCEPNHLEQNKCEWHYKWWLNSDARES